MGESQKQAFQLSFNRFLRVTFQGSRITSDGGLILVRELAERLGFGELIEQHLIDSRGKKHPGAPSLTCCGSPSTAAWQDTKTSTTPSGFPKNPTFRLIGSEKIWERGAALTSRLQSFENRTADARREPCWFGSDQPGFDRQGGSYGCAAPGGAGHGQHRDPGLRRTGAERLQRAFRVELLSPVVAVQSRG